MSQTTPRKWRITVLISGSGKLPFLLLDSLTLTHRSHSLEIPCTGSNLQAILDATQLPASDPLSLAHCTVTSVFSSRTDAFGLTRARTFAPSPTPAESFPLLRWRKQPGNEGKGRAEWERELARKIRDTKPDLVVLAGWMLILGEGFLDELRRDWDEEAAGVSSPPPSPSALPSLDPNSPSPISHGLTTPGASPYPSSLPSASLRNRPIPIINLHPALPGQFPGAHAIKDAWDAFNTPSSSTFTSSTSSSSATLETLDPSTNEGEVGGRRITKTGIMIHRVIPLLDAGAPVIVKEVPLVEGESLEGLEERIHQVEHVGIVEAVKEVTRLLGVTGEQDEVGSKRARADERELDGRRALGSPHDTHAVSRNFDISPSCSFASLPLPLSTPLARMSPTLSTCLTPLLTQLTTSAPTKDAQSALVDEVRKLVDEDVEKGGAGAVGEEVVRKGWEGCLSGKMEGWISHEAREGLDRLVGVVERGLEFGKLRESTAELLCLIVRRHHIAKRRKIEADTKTKLPLPITYSTDLLSPTAIPLSDIRTLPSFASRIEDLALPSQAASALRSVSGSTKRARVAGEEVGEEERVKSWCLLLRGGYENNRDHIERLSSWVIAQLQHELHDLEPTDAGAKRVADLFARVRELSEFAGELLEEFEPFLAEYLQRWDGMAHRKLVFDLLALIKPLRFEDLHHHYLRPLETFAKAESVDGAWIADFIACLTALVSNWAVRDDWDETVSRSTAFGVLEPDAPYLDALQGILAFANKQIELACQQRPHDLTIRSASLAFYELALTLPLDFGLPVVVLPSATFIHTCLLSNEVMSLSRICGILARLREALTGASTALEINSESNTALVTELNARLIEFVATLWQKRFLTPANPAQSSLGLEPEDLEDLRAYGDERGQATSASFGLSTHPALATLAKDCLAALAVERGKSASGLVGPISTSSLKQLAKEVDGLNISFNEFRPAFLEWAQEQGAEGLSDFLFSSLVSLVNRRASKSGSQTPA
ncbi:putative Phosphoribosylglycinamide formyltransferase [Rhodotorula toruloides ATCC 204091]|nr:putative Phosphoribosylglycinamide formyltransferase [Rhodotorula toruloides ATCC 204091]